MRERNMAIQGVRTLKRAYDAALKPVAEAHGLTRNEVDVLLFLANNPGYDTARDIVELRGLTKSHICQSVDGLTRRGWLSGVQDGQDRRRVHLSLLPAAQTAVAAAQAVQRDFFVRLYRGVSQKERETLERVQGKMLSNLKEAQQ